MINLHFIYSTTAVQIWVVSYILHIICDPNKVSQKQTRARKYNTKWQSQASVITSQDSEKKFDLWIIVEISWGRGGIFLSGWKLRWESGFWESLVQMASTVKISFPTLMLHTILHLLFSDSHQVTWLYTPKRKTNLQVLLEKKWKYIVYYCSNVQFVNEMTCTCILPEECLSHTSRV